LVAKKASGWHRKKRNTAAERARDAEYASPEYRAMERAIKAEVLAGRSVCWRCRRWIDPLLRTPWGARAWHVGHDDHDRSVIRGPEHWRCNLRPAASKGARKRNASQPRGASRVRL
jgi:hypothetical protein